jgi:hypothetical protein
MYIGLFEIVVYTVARHSIILYMHAPTCNVYVLVVEYGYGNSLEIKVNPT